jgi:hypothetical protein
MPERILQSQRDEHNVEEKDIIPSFIICTPDQIEEDEMGGSYTNW